MLSSSVAWRRSSGLGRRDKLGAAISRSQENLSQPARQLPYIG